MYIAKQLAIFLENKPGSLAKVCKALKEASINIIALSTGDTVDHNVVRMVVSHPDKARAIFDEHATMCVTTDVVMIEGNNRPGELWFIAEKLAEARINIEYCYCATEPASKKGILVLRASDTKKALKVLNSAQ